MYSNSFNNMNVYKYGINCNKLIHDPENEIMHIKYINGKKINTIYQRFYKNGRTYLKKRDLLHKYVESVIPGTIINKYLDPSDPRATLSDHQMINSIIEDKSLGIKINIASFNCCLTQMAHRGLDGFCNDNNNPDSRWHFMFTGDSFPEDDLRREYVCQYLLEQLETIPIIFVQEIDRKALELLKNHCKIGFSESNENTGGVAILVKMSTNINICDVKPIKDYWLNNNNESREKLIGQQITLQITNFNSDSKFITVSNFHLDKSSAHDSIKIVEEYAITSDYVLGDFNLKSNTLIRQIYKAYLENVTFEHNRNMVDNIFKVMK